MKTFAEIYSQIQKRPKQRISVAVAQDEAVLNAISMSHRLNLIDAILVGNKQKIKNIAQEKDIDISSFEIINIEDEKEATQKAVSIVHDGEADMYMKGAVDTATFLRSTLDHKKGLRTEKLMSHVAVFEIEKMNKLVIITDVAFVIYPNLTEKIQIIQNSVSVANACGIDMPRVAVLSAIETVNPKMPCTIDASELVAMNNRGEITNCLIDGPLSFDLAMVPEAASHKKSENRRIVGNADILLVPDIQAGNILYKSMVHFAQTKCGGILSGTSAPVILTSRSDSTETKINSIALAALVASVDKN